MKKKVEIIDVFKADGKVVIQFTITIDYGVVLFEELELDGTLLMELAGYHNYQTTEPEDIPFSEPKWYTLETLPGPPLKISRKKKSKTKSK